MHVRLTPAQPTRRCTAAKQYGPGTQQWQNPARPLRGWRGTALQHPPLGWPDRNSCTPVPGCGSLQPRGASSRRCWRWLGPPPTPGKPFLHLCMLSRVAASQISSGPQCACAARRYVAAGAVCKSRGSLLACQSGWELGMGARAHTPTPFPHLVRTWLQCLHSLSQQVCCQRWVVRQVANMCRQPVAKRAKGLLLVAVKVTAALQSASIRT
jgi:hypothetical protein